MGHKLVLTFIAFLFAIFSVLAQKPEHHHHHGHHHHYHQMEHHHHYHYHHFDEDVEEATGGDEKEDMEDNDEETQNEADDEENTTASNNDDEEEEEDDETETASNDEPGAEAEDEQKYNNQFAAKGTLILDSIADNGVYRDSVPGNMISTPEYDVTELEQSLLKLINEYRVQQGLKAVVYDEKLQEQARRHSIWMAMTDSLGHEGFHERTAVLRKTDNVNYTGENVYFCWYEDAERCLNAWKNSAGHNAIMLASGANVGAIGICHRLGHNRYYYTYFTAYKQE